MRFSCSSSEYAFFRRYVGICAFFRGYDILFRDDVDSNASANSTEILGETRNKYVKDTRNLPTEARTPRPGARLDRCGAYLGAHSLTERDRCSKHHSHSSHRRKGDI